MNNVTDDHPQCSEQCLDEIVTGVMVAHERMRGVVAKTPLMFDEEFSKRYGLNLFIKREDLQPFVRAYKIRGAYNLISSLSDEEKERGVVCASAGNHSSGFSFSCNHLGVAGVVFMPTNTPDQKYEKTKKLGNGQVVVHKFGDTFDEACAKAKSYASETGAVFVHPFDDIRIISGQGTVGKEIVEQMDEVNEKIDAVLIPVGGGGLLSGVGAYV